MRKAASEAKPCNNMTHTSVKSFAFWAKCKTENCKFASPFASLDQDKHSSAPLRGSFRSLFGIHCPRKLARTGMHCSFHAKRRSHRPEAFSKSHILQPGWFLSEPHAWQMHFEIRSISDSPAQITLSPLRQCLRHASSQVRQLR